MAKVIDTVLFLFAKFLLSTYRLRVINPHEVPKEGPCLFVGPHGRMIGFFKLMGGKEVAMLASLSCGRP